MEKNWTVFRKDLFFKTTILKNLTESEAKSLCASLNKNKKRPVYEFKKVK